MQNVLDRAASPNPIGVAQTTFAFASDLVGHWAFEGTGSVATDSSGNGNHGTLTGLTDTDRIPGIVGQAISLSSPSTFVTVPHSASLDISTSELSLAVWVKVNSFVGCDPSNDDPAIVEMDGNFFQLGFSGRCNDTPRFRLTTTSGTVAIKGSSPSTGIWHHFAAVYDGAQMRLYQDGVIVASAAHSGTVTMPIADLNIGHRDAFNSYIDGLIDEVRIYKTALSSSEVGALSK